MKLGKDVYLVMGEVGVKTATNGYHDLRVVAKIKAAQEILALMAIAILNPLFLRCMIADSASSWKPARIISRKMEYCARFRALKMPSFKLTFLKELCNNASN